MPKSKPTLTPAARAGIFADLLGLKLDDLHVTAKAAVDDELKAKLGKKMEELL